MCNATPQQEAKCRVSAARSSQAAGMRLCLENDDGLVRETQPGLYGVAWNRWEWFLPERIDSTIQFHWRKSIQQKFHQEFVRCTHDSVCALVFLNIALTLVLLVS